MNKIWIRTQDRTELLLCDYLRVRYYRDISSRCDIVTNDCLTLGTYQNEARALEVLDEIMKSIDVSPCYNMPEK